MIYVAQMTTKQGDDLISLQEGAKHAPQIIAASFEMGRTHDCILPSPEIIYLTKGMGTLDLDDGKVVKLQTGYLYIVAAGRVVLCVQERIHLILCRITEESAIPIDENFEELEEDLQPAIGLPYAAIKVNTLLQHFFLGVALYLNSGIGDENLLRTKITELFLIIRHSLNKSDYTRFFATLLNREYLFKVFVCKYAASVGTVAELAQLTNMSPRMLNTRFREYMGVSPKEFMHQERVKCIRGKLLDSDIPIKDIAYDYGLSVQYFCYLCKKEFGTTPTEMRSKRGALE